MSTPNSSRVDQVKTDEEIERHLNLPHKNSKLFLIKIIVIMKIIKLILKMKIIIVIIIMIIITLIITIIIKCRSRYKTPKQPTWSSLWHYIMAESL